VTEADRTLTESIQPRQLLRYRKHRDIVALQQLLGHSKIETTQRYLRSLGISYALERGYTSPGDWLDE